MTEAIIQRRVPVRWMQIVCWCLGDAEQILTA